MVDGARDIEFLRLQSAPPAGVSPCYQVASYHDCYIPGHCKFIWESQPGCQQCQGRALFSYPPTSPGPQFPSL